jgi:hypothetical protein
LLNWLKWCVGLHLIGMWCYFEMWTNDDIVVVDVSFDEMSKYYFCH